MTVFEGGFDDEHVRIVLPKEVRAEFGYPDHCICILCGKIIVGDTPSLYPCIDEVGIIDPHTLKVLCESVYTRYPPVWPPRGTTTATAPYHLTGPYGPLTSS